MRNACCIPSCRKRRPDRARRLIPSLSDEQRTPAPTQTNALLTAPPAQRKYVPGKDSQGRRTGRRSPQERRRRGYRSRFREPPSAPGPKACRRAWWRALHPVASLFAASEPRLGQTFHEPRPPSRAARRRLRILRAFRVHGEANAADGMDAVAAASHLEAICDADRRRVVRVDDRDDLAQLQLLEPVAKARPRALRR